MLLIVLLLGILFPFALVREFSDQARLQFDAIFGPEWVHWVMHGVLFACLALLLPASYRRPLRWRDRLQVVGVILLSGVLQEIFQALQKGFLYLGGAVFDLGVDLAGGLIGLLLAQFLGLVQSGFRERRIPQHVNNQ